ncbi:MAG: hypothetical protein PVSMB1_08430 [Gemmatimonadaceae bacterium]
MLYIHLDGLAEIRERHGNEGRNFALTRAASNLALLVRESDTVARLGDDDFMVVLPRVGSLENASAVAVKTLRALEAAVEMGGETAHVGAIIGIATYPEDGQEAATLLHMAEAAVYKARALGESIFPTHSHLGATYPT